MSKRSVGIIGGGGYTAAELIRILAFHPDVELKYVYSKSQSGKRISEVHEDLFFMDPMTFSSSIEKVDVLFLCQGHGKAKTFIKEHHIPEEALVIDLGNDFRIDNSKWVYGLPEINRSSIQSSRKIANCGCFATAIQLGLLPLAAFQLLSEDIHISAITGSTGAGQMPRPTTHFSWRNNNISAYKVFNHQHEAEVYQSINQLHKSYRGKLRFIPYRGNFSRGILATIYTSIKIKEEGAIALFKEYYEDHPFVQVREHSITLKSVVNSNYCLLNVSVMDGQVIVQSAIDNLVKGASGQAVQNMNLALGFFETSGLELKPLGY
jgi:N-acetyl-gamma-glutamyl-phosphate reductase